MPVSPSITMGGRDGVGVIVAVMDAVLEMLGWAPVLRLLVLLAVEEPDAVMDAVREDVALRVLDAVLLGLAVTDIVPVLLFVLLGVLEGEGVIEGVLLMLTRLAVALGVMLLLGVLLGVMLAVGELLGVTELEGVRVGVSCVSPASRGVTLTARRMSLVPLLEAMRFQVEEGAPPLSSSDVTTAYTYVAEIPVGGYDVTYRW